MKRLLIIIGIIVMTSSNLYLSAQQPYNPHHFLNNEMWSWSDGAIYSEKFFFSADGRFYHSRSYSTGIYWVEIQTGDYIFDSENLKIVLRNVKEEEGINRDGATRGAYKLPETLQITSMSEARVSLDRSEGLDSDKDDGFQRIFLGIGMDFSRVSYEYVLFPRNWNGEPIKVTVAWVGEDKKRNYVKKEDFYTILNFINSLSYSETLNDGRSIKIIPQDYVLCISDRIGRKSRTNNVTYISIWSHGLIHIGNRWYTPAPSQNLDDLISILQRRSKR